MDKLPSVFVNKKIIISDNNQKVFYSKQNVIEKPNKKMDVVSEINKIFLSPKYVYKIPVKIVTKDSSFKTELIAKNSQEVVTIKNEKIKISDIVYIEENNK